MARIVGRQSVAADGYVEYRNYDELNQFDHTAYGFRGRWLWSSATSSPAQPAGGAYTDWRTSARTGATSPT